MVAEIPKSKASIKQNRYEFKFEGQRKVYSLPLMKYLKPSLARDIEVMTEAEAIVHLFDAYYPGEDLFSKFEDGEQFEWFVTDWKDKSGIGLGESEDSSSS